MEEHVYIFVKNCKWRSGDNVALCVKGKRVIGSDGVTWAKSEGWFSLGHVCDVLLFFVCFFLLSQAVWTPQKWISENVGVWRTRKRLKRFESSAELKSLDVNGPFISATVQTIICYLLILPHFVPWNHFIHLFGKYLWSGWCVLSTFLAAEISLHKAHRPGGDKTSQHTTERGGGHWGSTGWFRSARRGRQTRASRGLPLPAQVCWGLKGKQQLTMGRRLEERELKEQNV